MKISFGFYTTFVVLSCAWIAYASDPSQLQDFCVAVPDANSACNSFNQIKPTFIIF